MGATTAAEAVLLVVSEMRTARIAENAAMATMLVMLRFWDAAVPMVSASPVAARSEPKMMPVPKKMMVPQSILAASDHVSVAWRVGGQDEEQRRSEYGHDCLVQPVIQEDVEIRVHARDQAGDCREQPETDGESESDQGVDFSPRHFAVGRLLLTDALLNALDPAHLGPVEQEHDHGQTTAATI
jgi:hypothetical protein